MENRLHATQSWAPGVHTQAEVAWILRGTYAPTPRIRNVGYRLHRIYIVTGDHLPRDERILSKRNRVARERFDGLLRFGNVISVRALRASLGK